MQTLGVTSLIFTLIGYWSGRLRELRDPQAALTPLLVGAAGAAASLVGYSLMEFLLGVDAPVSLELLRQIVIGVALDTLVALPMWAIVRRSLEGGLPDDPRRRAPARLHDRRAEPALALMSALERARPSDPRMPVSPQLALRVAVLGGLAMAMFAIIFFRLWYLQVLTGEQYVAAGERQPRARPADRRAARGDPRPRRPADREQPGHQRRADRALRAAARGPAEARAVPAAGSGCWG